MPYIAGGTSGVTTFSTLDVDSSGNVYIGGKSSDASFLGTSSVNDTDPFVIYIDSSGIVVWTAALPSIYNDVVAISYSSYFDNIAVATDSSDVQQD
jgi:hypothetical protein